MGIRTVCLAILLAGSLSAAGDQIAIVRGENAAFTVEAKLYNDPDTLKALLGHEIEKGIVAIEVTLAPKTGDPFEISVDDFLIRSDKDGQKSTPYDPGQIAGDAVLTVIYSQDGGGAHQQDNGPIWGGMGGTQPGRLPGSGSGIGNAGTVERASGVKMNENDAANPLLETLRERQLTDGELTSERTGLLFYPLEGKHKVKQIWLHYVGQGGKLDLQFKRPK